MTREKQQPSHFAACALVLTHECVSGSHAGIVILEGCGKRLLLEPLSKILRNDKRRGNVDMGEVNQADIEGSSCDKPMLAI